VIGKRTAWVGYSKRVFGPPTGADEYRACGSKGTS
jgi:hypothetical protein